VALTFITLLYEVGSVSVNFRVVPAFKEEMGDAVQGSHTKNGSASPLERQVSVAVLSCPECGTVVEVELGNGSLTCDCGGVRRIVKIVEGAPAQPEKK
jgi:hypothetical protein